MPLLDHFHPPLSGHRHWESFHAMWATCIAAELNRLLPDDYFAEAQVHAGPRIEIDVATWEQTHSPSDSGGVATLVSPSVKIETADLTLPATFPPEFGVHVYENGSGPTLETLKAILSPERTDTRSAYPVSGAVTIFSPDTRPTQTPPQLRCYGVDSSHIRAPLPR